MTLPHDDTVVLYPDGSTSTSASIVHAEPLLSDGVAEGLAVLLDRTAAHPVDTAWPDQGPDRGVLRAGGEEFELTGCVVGATDGSALFVGDDIPVKKGTEGWAFVVVHVLPPDAALGSDDAEIEVDADHRAALSRGHSACHLASLALNRALAGSWTKEHRADALGAPDFDAVACESSRIEEDGSVDLYRVGRSVRRSGFAPEVLGDLGAIETAVNMSLEAWTAAPAPIRIETEGDRLTDRRFWVCELPDGTARIPCGGTHARSLDELTGARVRLEPRDLDGAVGFTMATTLGG